MKFEKKIKELRLKHGLSQVELAKRLGVSSQRICNIERGKNSLASDKLQQVLSALGYKLKIEKK